MIIRLWLISPVLIMVEWWFSLISLTFDRHLRHGGIVPFDDWHLHYDGHVRPGKMMSMRGVESWPFDDCKGYAIDECDDRLLLSFISFSHFSWICFFFFFSLRWWSGVKTMAATILSDIAELEGFFRRLPCFIMPPLDSLRALFIFSFYSACPNSTFCWSCPSLQKTHKTDKTSRDKE